MLTLRTHDIMIFGGMNVSWLQIISFGHESRAEGNDEMSVPNYRYRD